VLLRHSIQYLGLRGKAVVANSGVLDSVEDFLNDMQDCSAEDHKAGECSICSQHIEPFCLLRFRCQMRRSY